MDDEITMEYIQMEQQSCQVMINVDECLSMHDIRLLCFGFVRGLVKIIGKSISPNDFVSVIDKIIGTDTVNQIKTCICDSNGNPDYKTLKVMYVSRKLIYD